ncbi:uncharacterized protein [Polyergus mexicanus]|uniref:uncharacterized protein isoform X2 n=1 Tax=Polyergus mexicanus TaxID=615972 RepID=UPI0038B4EC59
MSYLFKVWSANRKQKISLVINQSDNMLSELITKSNNKLGINGSTLVMEKDGTNVDGINDVLKFCSGEIFMLLQSEEFWSPQNETELHSTASCDTLSIHSDSMSIFSSSSSTRHVSSPTTVSHIKIQSDNNEIWTRFRIPWDNLESTVLKELEVGNRSKYVIHTVVNRIVSEMRNLQEFIPSKAFKIIAKKVIEKYPQTFKDMDEDGKCFGDGGHTLYLKLRDRNCYLNRPHMKRSLSRSLNIPLKKQRKVLSAKVGCSNWQPDNYVESETEDIIEDKTEFLRQVILQDDLKSDPDIQKKIYLYLEVTYPAQRLFLNNVHKPPTIQNIKTSWPILLQKKYLFWHYHKLMGHSICILKEQMLKKQKKIFTYGHLKNYKEIINSTELIELKLIKIIMKHFKEDFYLLFKTYPEGTALKEIEASIAAPCIVIVEAIQIERTYCFYEALEMLMSAYYVFNMEYPTHCACTLEFIQKYFLNIHPISGTKSRKVATKYKVLSFFNKLRDIEERDVDKENILSNS